MKKDISQVFVYPKTWVSRETEDIAKSVRQWASKEIVSRRLEYLEDLENLFPRLRSKLAFDIGCQGLMFPPESGGPGLNSVEAATTLIMVLKEISRADAGIAFIYAMEYALCALAVSCGGGRPEIYETLAPFFCGDKMGSVSLVLPSCGLPGEDPPLFEGRPVRASLKEEGSGLTVEGRSLRPLDLGAEADVFAVVCADENGEPGVAALAGDAEGVKRGGSILKTGLEGCRNAEIDINRSPVLPGLWLPGDAAVRSLYTWTNLFLGAVSTGSAMGCMEVAAEWSESRVIKGKGLIRDNPLCASVLAEAYEETAVSWTLLHHLAYALANPGEWGDSGSRLMFAQAQMTGRRVQAGAMLAVNKMMELMASEGYAREGRMEKAWRDIKTIQAALSGAGGEARARLDSAGYVFDSFAG